MIGFLVLVRVVSQVEQATGRVQEILDAVPHAGGHQDEGRTVSPELELVDNAPA